MKKIKYLQKLLIEFYFIFVSCVRVIYSYSIFNLTIIRLLPTSYVIWYIISTMYIILFIVFDEDQVRHL